MLPEQFMPVGDRVQTLVEGCLGLDDAADSVVGAKVGVEVGVVGAEALVHSVAGLEYRI